MLLQKKKNTDINPAAALVTGVIIGAGAAVAGAALKDKKNREKIKKAVNEAKTHVNGYVKSMQSTTNEKKNEVKEKSLQSEKEPKKIADVK